MLYKSIANYLKLSSRDISTKSTRREGIVDGETKSSLQQSSTKLSPVQRTFTNKDIFNDINITLNKISTKIINMKKYINNYKINISKHNKLFYIFIVSIKNYFIINYKIEAISIDIKNIKKKITKLKSDKNYFDNLIHNRKIYDNFRRLHKKYIYYKIDINIAIKYIILRYIDLYIFNIHNSNEDSVNSLSRKKNMSNIPKGFQNRQSIYFPYFEVKKVNLNKIVNSLDLLQDKSRSSERSELALEQLLLKYIKNIDRQIYINNIEQNKIILLFKQFLKKLSLCKILELELNRICFIDVSNNRNKDSIINIVSSQQSFSRTHRVEAKNCNKLSFCHRQHSVATKDLLEIKGSNESDSVPYFKKNKNILNPLLFVNNCVICRDPINSSKYIKKLPCCTKATFHMYCIIQWLQKYPKCPLCRAENYIYYNE